MSCDIISQTEPVAQESHRCIWCGEEIQSGEKHIHSVLKYYSHVFDQRWHCECSRQANEDRISGTDPEFAPYENERPAR